MAQLKKRAAQAAGWTLAAAVAVLLFELGSAAWFYADRGVFFYTASRVAPTELARTYQVAKAVFHPYLAFLNRVGRKGDGYGTNNHGWFVHSGLLDADPRCCDVPTIRKDGEIVVAVFGGSVGTGFGLAAQKTGSLGRMIAALPAYAGRKVTVLNFSMPGYRQPQQLLALTYYLSLGQAFDIVINLDGFNEAVTTVRNWESGVSPTYPADTVWGEMGRVLERGTQGLQDSGYIDVIYHHRAAAEAVRAMDDCTIASCYALKRASVAYHLQSAERASSKAAASADKVSLFPSRFRETFPEKIDISEFAADRWAGSASAMARLLRGSGSVFVQVLQPNQWYRPSGDYRPIDANHIYKWVVEPVNRGYDAMRRRIPALEKEGVEVLDGAILFKNLEDRLIYSDDCCHYTDEANERLSRAIADRIARLSREARPN